MGNRVGIVGGGPGGLMTAYLLRKLANRPLELTVFESTERVGGKILTPRFSTIPATYEAGAAEFYDYTPVDEDPLKQLVTELGLSVSSMGGNSVIMSGKKYSTLEDLGEAFGASVHRGWSEFHERAWGRMSPREFYESDNSECSVMVADGGPDSDAGRFDLVTNQLENRDLQGFLETLIHSDLATEWQHTSVAYGLQNYLMNHPDYMRLYSIEGGNEQLAQRLQDRTEMDLRTGHRVLSVERSGQRELLLRVQSGESITEHHFDYVVVCLPMIPLSSLEFRGERLAKAMRQHVGHYDHPAHYLRVTLLFRQPFWKPWLTESYCMLDAYGGCCLYDETSRQPAAGYGILGWLFGGDAAVGLSELTDEELIEKAIETLPETQREAREQLLEARVHRWIGAVSAMPGGERPMRLDLRHQPEPAEHPGFFVVGDYLFDSTLNGVLDSADCVAGWIAAALEE